MKQLIKAAAVIIQNQGLQADSREKVSITVTARPGNQ